MIQSKLFPFSLILLALPITFPKFAQAQFITPYNGGPCGLGNCRNGGNGTYIQKKSGDVYDRKGNLLNRGNGSTSSNGGQFNKAECDAAVNTAVQRKFPKADLDTIGEIAQYARLMAESTPACRS
jgi:hypothetical protein